MQVKIKKQLKCERCGYEWNPRKSNVRVCPGCHSPYWDKKKVLKVQQSETGNGVLEAPRT